jgi:outer membrane protein
LRGHLRGILLVTALGCTPLFCRSQSSVPDSSRGAAGVPSPLSLEAAEQIALKNHPRIGSATYTAQAAGQVVSETKSQYFPTIVSTTTGAVANTGTVQAAGALTTSSLSNRLASGITIAQLVTDFGRTNSLTGAARLRVDAQNHDVISARAQTILAVRSAYYGVLASDAVLRVAQAALSNRQLLLRQITALSQSALRSTLDVSFARVLVSQAQLAVYEAENNGDNARAELASSMGLVQSQRFALVEQDLPPALGPELQPLLAEAMAQRPDLLARERDRDATRQFAQAEKRLADPTLSFAASAGGIPDSDHTLSHNSYEAAGLILSIPIFNGGLFAARREEALARANAADKDVENYALQVTREVQKAWYEVNTAFRRLDVTAQLVDEASESVRLAQARYDAGLGGIVELNQAQLNQIQAQIDAAGAKYDYLGRRTILDFAIGTYR